jgi:4-amino-4-deoxy-L-arabinose transferase-like glycosyltransferase
VPLFDWDEVNFAECAREMRLSGEYRYAQVGFLPFWEKPPLFFWVQALSMEIFGENAQGARWPNVLITGVTLGVLYLLGRRWYSAAFGWIWVLFYGTALLPAFYARSGLIDPLFNLFMLLAAMTGTRALEGPERAWRWGGLSGLWMGLAVLTKGPIGIGLPALAILTTAALHRRWKAVLVTGLSAMGVVSLLVGSWIAWLYAEGVAQLIRDFWAYQWRLFSTADAGHHGPWYYHLVVWLIGLLPTSGWAILGLVQLRRVRLSLSEQTLLWLMTWTLLIFSVVKTKILHYSSLGYFGVTYLAVLGWWRGRQKEGLLWALTGVLLMLLAVVTVLLPLLMIHLEDWVGLIRDEFVLAALRSQPFKWDGLEGWGGLILLGGIGVAFLVRMRRSLRLVIMAVSLALWVSLTLWTYAPRAAAYSQEPLVAFCQKAAAEGAIVWPLGFKSYVPYFYGRMMPTYSPGKWGSLVAFEQALLSGGVDRPVYFVSRVDRYKPYVEAHALQVVEKAGGYVLLIGHGLPYQTSAAPPLRPCTFGP